MHVFWKFDFLQLPFFKYDIHFIQFSPKMGSGSNLTPDLSRFDKRIDLLNYDTAFQCVCFQFFPPMFLVILNRKRCESGHALFFYNFVINLQQISSSANLSHRSGLVARTFPREVAGNSQGGCGGPGREGGFWGRELGVRKQAPRPDSQHPTQIQFFPVPGGQLPHFTTVTLSQIPSLLASPPPAAQRPRDPLQPPFNRRQGTRSPSYAPPPPPPSESCRFSWSSFSLDFVSRSTLEIWISKAASSRICFLNRSN